MKIDLHNHTTYSDGVLSPQKLVDLAITQGIDCFALTDHDSVFGCEEIQTYAKKVGMRVLNGMELSTNYKGYSVHIVCLFSHNKVPEELIRFSLNKKEERKTRAILMMKKIQEIYHLKMDIEELIRENEVITRANMGYHLAKYNGFSQKDAEPYIDQKSKAYIPSTKLSVKEGLQMVKSLGCLTILAHPCLLPRDIVEEILPMGFDGIEVRYPKNHAGDEEYFKDLAKQFHLLISAGSDFHGDQGTKHAMIGTSSLTEAEFRPMLERLELQW